MGKWEKSVLKWVEGQGAGLIDVLLVEFRKKAWRNEAGARKECDKGHLSVGPEKILD